MARNFRYCRGLTAGGGRLRGDTLSPVRHRGGAGTKREMPHPRALALTQGPGRVSSRGGGGALAHSGHTSRSLSYAMPWIAQRSIRTSAPLAGWAGSGPVTGVCAGMDRAPSPSIVTPSSVHPHWPTRLRLPVPRDPGVTLGRDGPVTWHPDVSPGGLLPRVRAGDPDVRGTRLARHRLHRRRRWWRGGLDGGRPHVVAAAHDQERKEQQKVSGNPTTPHVPLHSPRVWSRLSSAEASTWCLQTPCRLRASVEQGTCHTTADA
jgi:hypothetical protein